MDDPVFSAWRFQKLCDSVVPPVLGFYVAAGFLYGVLTQVKNRSLT